MATDIKDPPVQKREIFGWAMYDFANSSYTTVIISLLYSAFFVEHIVPAGSEVRDTYWSIAIIASTVVAIILSPFVGAICDYSGRKKRYLAYSTVTCAIGTAALYFADPGSVWFAIILVTISNAAFMLGEAFCGSFLPELATKKTMGIISGLGWGLGYFGGLTSLVILKFVVTAEDTAPAYIDQNQLAVVFIGIFYVLAAIPMFLLVKERSKPTAGYEDAGIMKLAKAGFSEISQTMTIARENSVLFRFFLAFTVYMAGLEVVIKFIGIYAKAELGLTTDELVSMFIIIQVSAALGAIAFGFLEARLGAKKTVLFTIVWWIFAIFGIFFLEAISNAVGMEQSEVFLGIGLMAGAGIGSIQSSSRAVVGLLSPPDRTAQMFGFWGMFMRIAIIMGMSFGFLADAIGSRRYALLLVVGFFAVGGFMLLFVPIDRVEGVEDETVKTFE